MSQPVLLDTSALLTLIRGGHVAQRMDEHLGLSRRQQRPFVSIVSHGEIRVLAALRRWGPQKLQALRETLTQTVAVNISPPEVLEAYVRLDLHSRRHPDGARHMGKNDLWIAACAAATGATLVTLDRGFEHLADQIGVAWFDPAG